MHNLVNTRLYLSSSWDASPVQHLEKRAKVFFLAPFPFVGDELFCSEKYSGLPLSLPRRWEENWKLTYSSKSSQDGQTSQLTPKPITCHAHRGTGALRLNCSKQTPSDSLSLQGMRALATERERADRKARDSYTFRKRKYIWISIRRIGGESLWSTADCWTRAPNHNHAVTAKNSMIDGTAVVIIIIIWGGQTQLIIIVIIIIIIIWEGQTQP